ncbi:hypothetical protein N9H70_04300 [Pseudomonadales bacterium]|nr:hypothetical protein [Pseudomonadales bacterium]
MKKIIINGMGWSGSSAFINLLELKRQENYFVMPGEFDDFRVPGSMRESLVSSNPPKSIRWKNLKPSIPLIIRSLVSDKIWPNFERGKTIKRVNAAMLSSGIFKEKSIFDKYSSALLKEDNIENRNILLSNWMNDVCRNYSRFNNKASMVFIEQFFLFDDDPKLYAWLEFDKLILFIRRPKTQLTASLEALSMYDNYPWVAEYLIGREDENNTNKYELFTRTTMKRYSWIERFLKSIKSDKALIVDFDSFLYDTENTIDMLSSELDCELKNNLQMFDIENSKSRDKEWDNSIVDLSKLLNEAQIEYEIFKNNLSKQYLVI